ncbi:MAG: hypothetical protein J6R12_05710 [Bacteroidales bacterium]|nr:hypothetical protein [Bacteroidales bacterium]
MGHTWVDLGLPSGLKWATCNVGATSPEEFGDYFAWGETVPKSEYSWESYEFFAGFKQYSNIKMFNKYNTNSNHGLVDNKTTLELSDDAAHVNWGGKWRMPTKAEQDELRNNCDWTQISFNGVKGYDVKGPNGNRIFLPVAGYRDGTSVYGFFFSSLGGCWSSSLSENNPSYAFNLGFYEGSVDWYYNFRSNGRTVRAVCP